MPPPGGATPRPSTAWGARTSAATAFGGTAPKARGGCGWPPTRATFGRRNDLGNAYANGAGVAQDAAQAVRWFRRAAERGFAIAQGNLGLAYANGVGIAADDETGPCGGSGSPRSSNCRLLNTTWGWPTPTARA